MAKGHHYIYKIIYNKYLSVCLKYAFEVSKSYIMVVQVWKVLIIRKNWNKNKKRLRCQETNYQFLVLIKIHIEIEEKFNVRHALRD